ncbi:hypothetical protein [Anatilimnocola floriformis]|uniref:hypothetical protein n=1 Tax=Anatilimnocola floriformis TaxID=2948575 RepID=UPI0020C2C8C3|nr:hypothetical protein [Anatilimnocola floriformis]
MPYTTSCPCGRDVPVEATQAGTELECPGCRRSVRVPRLSALRVAAGETAIPLNAAERVAHAVKQGLLPSNLVCPVTHGSVNAVAIFRIHCERSWKREQAAEEDHAISRLITMLLFSFVGLFVWTSRKGKQEVLGRDTFVDTPLGVSSEALPQLSRQRNQRELQRLLCAIPEYAAVFAEYPGATVSFVSGAELR